MLMRPSRVWEKTCTTPLRRRQRFFQGTGYLIYRHRRGQTRCPHPQANAGIGNRRQQIHRQLRGNDQAQDERPSGAIIKVPM